MENYIMISAMKIKYIIHSIIVWWKVFKYDLSEYGKYGRFVRNLFN